VPTSMSFLKIRAEQADLERWKQQADSAGMNLSRWTRNALRNPSATVSQAIERGILVRPEQCSNCGKKCKPQAHHDDYNKLLEVRWLCPQCHADWHGEHEPIRTDETERRVVVLVTPDEHAELKRRAGLVALSTWIRAKILEINHGPSEHQDVRPVSDVPMVERSAPEPERPRALPRKPKTKVSARASKQDAGNSGPCHEPVGPGIYCPKCGRRH